ncbi:TolC family outer membrane protein [Caulobacter sp. KR2-114]|uniref:TolC family outer membrane protein n=1 Tax=Caulobacter sp. KR2-114 TaxID=3400912 RepID=UPI003C0A0BDA
MRRVRGLVALIAALVLAAPSVHALSLEDAVALARRSNPDLAAARAQADAATARLKQAQAGRLPTVTLSGEAGTGTTDLGGFFGFGRADVRPRAGAVELRQPLFAGGALTAAVEGARAGRDAALARAAGAEALLSAQAAEAYVGVQSAEQMLALLDVQVTQTTEVERQARLRFEHGEIARTDVAQAEARLAAARAALARGQGALEQRRAHFTAVTGAEPSGLEPSTPPADLPASLDEALAAAERSSPSLRAAESTLAAAEAAVRGAEGARAPSLAFTASASAVRDQFFPGYQANDVTVGVQGRWVVFSGGAVSGRIAEAQADRRAAQAGRDGARAQLREAVTGAWADLVAARSMIRAADAQVQAADSALDSVANEVRVGQKPTLDLLDAQSDRLAAQAALIDARGQAVAAAWRLRALLGAD